MRLDLKNVRLENADRGDIVRILFYQQFQMQYLMEAVERLQMGQKALVEAEMFSKKKFLRPAEARDYYGVGESTMEKLARNAEAVVKVDRLKWIDTEALDDFLRSARA